MWLLRGRLGCYDDHDDDGDGVLDKIMDPFKDEDDDDDCVQQARGARRHSGEMEGNNQSVPGSPLR